ncbi:hypothetical protein AAHZ94_31035 [Streptomyces sp. HSW2009]|uniref:hypothetical protein n=1 Tax=Streptomyces sp. HSW2009 TaxID=3142890 RepID=UPI0032EAFE24
MSKTTSARPGRPPAPSRPATAEDASQPPARPTDTAGPVPPPASAASTPATPQRPGATATTRRQRKPRTTPTPGGAKVPNAATDAKAPATARRDPEHDSPPDHPDDSDDPEPSHREPGHSESHTTEHHSDKSTRGPASLAPTPRANLPTAASLLAADATLVMTVPNPPATPEPPPPTASEHPQAAPRTALDQRPPAPRQLSHPSSRAIELPLRKGEFTEASLSIPGASGPATLISGAPVLSAPVPAAPGLAQTAPPPTPHPPKTTRPGPGLRPGLGPEPSGHAPHPAAPGQTDPEPPPEAPARTTHAPRPRGPLWRAARARVPGWWPVVFGAALGLGGGAAYGLLATPEYTATSYVVAVPADGTDPATALGFAQAYGRITTGGAVLSAAQRSTGTPVEDLRASVRTATSPDAPMIEVTGADARPARAATTANAVARALAGHANRSARNTGVRLTVFAPAVPPTTPTSPSFPLSLAVGGCAGGLLGALALLVRPTAGRAPAPASPPAPESPSGSESPAGSASPPGPTPAPGSTAAPGRRPEAEAPR